MSIAIPHLKTNLQELIEKLEHVANSSFDHTEAQRYYFRKSKNPTPLWNCGTRCCIAGDKILRDALKNDFKATMEILKGDQYDIENRLVRILLPENMRISAWNYARLAYDLTIYESTLAFGSDTSRLVHLYLIDLWKKGERFPDKSKSISVNNDDYYAEQIHIYFDGEIIQSIEELEEIRINLN